MAKSATAASKKKAKPAAKKTSSTTSAAATTTRVRTTKSRSFNWDFTPTGLIGEFLGTMLLVSAIVITSGNQFYIGVTLIALAAVLLPLSGSHLNPAVSFGLWAMRKISAVRMAAYWVAQFLGALAATLTLYLFSGEKFGINLGSFFQFDGKIFSLEVIGMTAFMFIAAAAYTAVREGVVTRAATLGLGLFVGLVMASGLLAQASQGATSNASAEGQAPRITQISTATLNPAAALVVTENDAASQQAALTGEAPEESGRPASRLTLETLLGTLFGAALGASLYRLVAAAKPDGEVL